MVTGNESLPFSRPIAPSRAPGLGRIDLALVCLFIIGLYTHYTIMISAKVPLPSVIAGVAGLILLWRQRDRISEVALSGLVCVVLLYLGSILSATDLSHFNRRLNGWLQLSYSLTIGYALFLTVTGATRRQIGMLFLTIALVILAGCVLETYAGLGALSDTVRGMLYSEGIYANDLRDVALYGRVRPKFFASEPSSVTFIYSILCFFWYVVSAWRWKLLAYLGLVAAGLLAMPGPTLLLMLLLIGPYELFFGGRRAPGSGIEFGHLLKLLCIGAAMVAVLIILVTTIYAARFDEILAGNDESFFYRVRGPALAALHIIERYPMAGAGLTGDTFAEADILNVYVQSAAFSATWRVNRASEWIINYFWLHWVYLGLGWGLITLFAISLWLRALGVPSVMFCWMTWAVLGQASGAYVGPLCWSVLFLAAAAAVLRAQQPAIRMVPDPTRLVRSSHRSPSPRGNPASLPASAKPVSPWCPEAPGQT
jgi:hypothetical protein